VAQFFLTHSVYSPHNQWFYQFYQPTDLWWNVTMLIYQQNDMTYVNILVSKVQCKFI